MSLSQLEQSKTISLSRLSLHNFSHHFRRALLIIWVSKPTSFLLISIIITNHRTSNTNNLITTIAIRGTCTQTSHFTNLRCRVFSNNLVFKMWCILKCNQINTSILFKFLKISNWRLMLLSLNYRHQILLVRALIWSEDSSLLPIKLLILHQEQRIIATRATGVKWAKHLIVHNLLCKTI